VTALLTVLAYALFGLRLLLQPFFAPAPHLLTDPFLQLPSPTSVQVVWFSEFNGKSHQVQYGNNLEQIAIAKTTKLSRVREDQQSNIGNPETDGQPYSKPTYREIWRHEAAVTDLQPNQRLPYRVQSTREDGQVLQSDRFTLAPTPTTNQPLKILLTSDHQLMPMTPANLQKVVETVGQVDVVLMAGDLVNVPDRASEWFDDSRGGAFFPSLQGRARYELERGGIKTRYQGGAIIQSAPLFTALGNHEVMGRFSLDTPLNDQFNDPIPSQAVEPLYQQVSKQINPTDDPMLWQNWMKNHTFNSDTYEEIFSLPNTSPGGKKYYAVTFGGIRLISLYATNIWRVPSLEPDARGRYRERDADLADPLRWGYGQHIFEPIAPGSPQYNWLQSELNSPEFQQAKYKIVMLHHPPHSLGDNIVPAYTNPVQIIDRFANGQIKSVRYEYPLAQDYLIRDVIPLLENAGVQLVHYGHSHLWNRFISPSGMHFLETSNVGNSYGAFIGNQRRNSPIGFKETYAVTGDPNGLEPIVPTLNPLQDENQNNLPYIASNDITVFSILETGSGIVSSYRFDTSKPNSEVVKFDQFLLGRQ
jgi:hypothetical protein